MKKFLIFGLFALGFLSLPAKAQVVAVTGTVLDPGGNVYQGCQVNVSYVPSPTATTVPTINGSTFSTTVPVVQCNSFGQFSVSLIDNNLISDGHTGGQASQWAFFVRSASVCFAGNTVGFSDTLTITGTSQDISASLRSAAAPLPTCGGTGGGNISGSISSGQVAFGATAFDNIAGSANFTYSSLHLLLQDTACPVTAIASVTFCGTGLGTGFNGAGAQLDLELVGDTNSQLVIASTAGTGNSGSTRKTFTNISQGSAADGDAFNIAYNYNNGLPPFGVISIGGTGPPPSGVTEALFLNLSGSVELGTNNADGSVTESFAQSNGAYSILTESGFPLNLGGIIGGHPGTDTPVQWSGQSSGSAEIGAASIAGTPNRINLPTTSPSGVTQILGLSSISGSISQLAWVNPSGGISGLTTGFLPKAASSTSLANSLCDEGITTANTFTCGDTSGATFLGTVKAAAALVAGTLPTACGTATGIWCATEGSTAGTPTSGQDYIRADTSHKLLCSINGGAEVPCSTYSATSTAFATATTAGTCVSSVTAVTGATTSMVAMASPATTPGIGAEWSAFISSAGNVTIIECAVATSAGGTIAFNIRVLP